VATSANLGGLGIGPLLSGQFAEHASAPLRTPYLVFLALLVLGAAALLLAPETVDRPHPRPAYRPQRLHIPKHARTQFYTASSSAFIAFAVFGLFTSLTPVVLLSLHIASPATTGFAAFLVFGSAALAHILLDRLSSRTQLLLGLSFLVAGVVAVTIAVWTADLALFLIGGAISGAAAGTAFKGSAATVLSSAGSERRGEALAGLFLAAYLGLSIPVLGLGLTAQVFPVRDALLAFTGAIVLTTALISRRIIRT
jgi:MFS family permease